MTVTYQSVLLFDVVPSGGRNGALPINLFVDYIQSRRDILVT